MQHAVLEIFVWLFGLCVGSFLNVVVYRLPAGLSLASPARSFCPRCRAGIAWYDNIPLLSWLLLRSRCRHCAGSVSAQYPLVEGLTGLSFVLVYHLLFVGQARAGVAATQPTDLPLLLSWLVLTAGLVACSAMDIVSYSIDVRITNTVLCAGVLLHALWPRREFLLSRTDGPVAGAALAAFVVSGLMLWWSARRLAAEEVPTPELESREDDPPAAAEPVAARAGGCAGVLVTVVLVGWLVFAGRAGSAASRDLAVAASLATAFAALVLAGGQPRAADEEIKNAVNHEQPQARRMACQELAWLMPAAAAAALTWLLLAYVPAAGSAWRSLTAWSVGGQLVPLAGLTYAAYGAIIAAAAGWALRIVFTLGFGREAFGTGDIYILAAAGAAAGWDVALLGLLLSVGIALLGWLLGLLLKSTTMIPFGPWLSLGTLLALWWSRPAQRMAETYRDNALYLIREHPGTLPILVGLMLVGTAAAIVLARLLRRWLVPD